MAYNRCRQSTILFVHSSDDTYGADVILLQLVRRLDKRRFRPIVALPNDVTNNGPLSKLLSEDRIETVSLGLAVLRRKYFTFIGIPIYLWRLLKSTVALSRLIRHESVDLVHSHTSAVLSGAFAASFTKTPHVWQTLEIITRPRFLWRLLSWLMPYLSDTVVAASGPTLDHLCAGNRLNITKAIVIRNGIDTRRFDVAKGTGQHLRDEWGIRSSQPLIGMIGRVSHFKGQEYFLRVASLVSQTHPEAHFAMVGGTFPGQETLLAELRALVQKLGLSSVVHMSDFRTDIPAVLDAFDIVVLPSALPDPFPTVVLEAMGAAKPVVANAHGGSIEMVDDGATGLLVKPDQPQGMAAAISHLINNPGERLAMGQRGRNRVMDRFSLESFVAQYVGLYEKLLYQRNDSFGN